MFTLSSRGKADRGPRVRGGDGFLPDPIRHRVPAIGVHQNRPVARRKGALVAIVARADAARRADACRRLWGVDIYAIGIDEIARILRLAPQRDGVAARSAGVAARRSEEHTSELQSLMRISYAVFCLKKKNTE